MKTRNIILSSIFILGIIIGIYFLYFKKESYLTWYNNNNYSIYKQEDSIILKENYRNIFCYWDTEDLPPIVNECIKKIKKEMFSK